VINQANVGGHVFLRGHVADEELEGTYARAIALLFPSLAEGFGFPILEAMSRAIPVVTSDRSACAEVAGGTALLVDPYDVESIAGAICKVATEPRLREELARLGRARASLFSWGKCATETLDVIRDVLESS
jgi:glycosyltransferase involved in cell wall biosynthesis